MRNIYIYLYLGLILCSCNNVPNKSIFEPLSTNELAKIIKSDTSFAEFYQHQQEITLKLNEIDKAKYNDITYRNLYKMYKYVSDSTIMKPLKENWNTEWQSEFGIYTHKIDSVLNYWRNYKNNNSLNRFVRIEFAELYKEYYSYSGDVKNVNIGFRLTPLQGKIEQIKFNYRYSAKINDFYGDKNNCISTSPFASPVVRYWEVNYSDEKKLKNSSTSEFNRDYDIKIEITDIRKDDKNYSITDFNIPESVVKVLEEDSIRYPYLYNSYKEDIAKDILRPDYKGYYDFKSEKITELLKSKFPREYSYSEYVATK